MVTDDAHENDDDNDDYDEQNVELWSWEMKTDSVHKRFSNKFGSCCHSSTTTAKRVDSKKACVMCNSKIRQTNSQCSDLDDLPK